MILTADIANSKIEICAVQDGQRVYSCALSSETRRTPDEFSVVLSLLFEKNDIDLLKIEGAIVASVVPALTKPICRAIELCTGCCPLVVGPGIKTGLSIRIDDPAALGADLAASAASAISKYPLPCIVINMETATAICVIDERANYIGGAICPGITMGQLGLERGTAKLASVVTSAPRNVIGKNTTDCMQSGIIFGAAAMLDGIIERTISELGHDATVVATGNWAKSIIPHCKHAGITIDSDLVMHGLYLIWLKNR